MIISSCGVRIPYRPDYPLKNEIFYSRDKTLSGRVPQDWFISNDDSLAPSLSVWLLKEDLSATIVIRELILDELAVENVRRKGLKILAAVSAAYHDIDIVKSKIVFNQYKLGTKDLCSFEYGEGNQHSRFVVFTINKRYYECEARFLKEDWKLEDIKALHSAQETVLYTLVY